MDEDRQARDEEKLALTSIYTPDFLQLLETSIPDQTSFLVRFSVNVADGLPATTAILTIHLPPTYPRSEAPVYEIKEAYGEPAWITNDDRLFVKKELQAMFDATSVNGSDHGVVLFEWIEWLRDWLDSAWRHYLDQHLEFVERFLIEQQKSESLSSVNVNRNQGPETRIEEVGAEKADDQNLPDLPPVFHSAFPLIDRKSVFIAHVAPVSSVEEVNLVRSFLLSNPKIGKATHNILAYRIMQHRPSVAGGEVVVSDCDDDGESAAGGRLLHLLNICKCRNVMVVVSRWYGGTLLGPDRFKHINNVARELLHSQGFIP